MTTRIAHGSSISANENCRHIAPSKARIAQRIGFPVLVKPNAWCASHVADYAVKGKHFRARMHAA